MFTRLIKNYLFAKLFPFYLFLNFQNFIIIYFMAFPSTLICTNLVLRQYKQMLQLPRWQLDSIQWASSIEMVRFSLSIPISKREPQIPGFWRFWFEHNWNSDGRRLEKLASSVAGYSFWTLFGSPQLVNCFHHRRNSERSWLKQKYLFVRHRKQRVDRRTSLDYWQVKKILHSEQLLTVRLSISVFLI